MGKFGGDLMRHTDETRQALSVARTGDKNGFRRRAHDPEVLAQLRARPHARTVGGTYMVLPQKVRIPDRETLAYLAGLVDADGSIRFKTDHSTKAKVSRPFLTVYNTNRPLIEWLVATFGNGCVAKGNLGREQVLSWTIQASRDVYALVGAIRPWLIVKAADADDALDYLREKYQWD